VVAAEAARGRRRRPDAGRAAARNYLTVGAVSTPPDIAGKLGSDDAIARRRLMLIEDEPAQLLPREVAEGHGAGPARALNGGTVAALRRLGYNLTRFHEE
jgi:hypothetical protein